MEGNLTNNRLYYPYDLLKVDSARMPEFQSLLKKIKI